MAHTPGGACVHCLRATGPLTWDHGVPLAFYPSGASGQKIKAPSCRDCQARLRLVEERLLHTLGVCLDPRSPTSAAVAERVARALDAKRGRDSADAQRRERARARMERAVFVPTSAEGAVPGFERSRVDGSPAVTLSPADIEAFGEKVARVAVWHTRQGALINEGSAITTHLLRTADAEEVDALIRRHGTAIRPCEGVAVTVATAADCPEAHLVLIELWERLRLHVAVAVGRLSSPAD